METKHLTETPPSEVFIGLKNGPLTVVGQTDIIKGRRWWICECKCGKTCRRSKKDLIRKPSRGCAYSCPEYLEFNRIRKTTHGYCGHPILGAWRAMVDRCTNPNNHAYHNYGERGITVCDRWLNSFTNFLQDMKDTWERGLELDRIDNSKGYSPDNCRWTTRKENLRNRRVAVLRPDVLDAMEMNQLPRATIHWLMRDKGMNQDQALAHALSIKARKDALKKQ